MSEEKKTTAENKVTKSVGKPEKKEIQQDCMMTGLSDYGFWSQKVKEEVAGGGCLSHSFSYHKKSRHTMKQCNC